MTFEFIIHIENNIFNLDDRTKNLTRKDIILILNSIKYKLPNSTIDSIIKHGLKELKVFLTNHPSLLITRADKGNTTVILTTKDYLDKIHDILSDNDTYRLINKDLTNKLTTGIRSLLTCWKSKGFIDQYVYKKKLYISDWDLPRSYGLPKIHKEGIPLRMIVSCINSPLYNLAVFLKEIIDKSLNNKKNFGYIKNSFELVKKINGLPLRDGYRMVSFDISSMYFNIPNDLALRSVLGRWNLIEKNTSIPFQEFKRAISIILNSTFFKFNDEFYEQIIGLPMGSPLSPILADLVIQDLENDIFNTLTTHIFFYFRYVDIVLAAPINLITNILDSFNTYHDRIKFTVDYGNDKSINFLDVKLLIDNDRIIFDLYKKPTNSDRFLNFFLFLI